MSQSGSVYFIQELRHGDATKDLIKIGWSKNAEARLFSIGPISPFPMEIIAVFEGTRKTEAKLHKRFSQSRTRGEWFLPCKEILEIVRLKKLPDLSGEETGSAGTKKRKRLNLIAPKDWPSLKKEILHSAADRDMNMNAWFIEAVREKIARAPATKK